MLTISAPGSFGRELKTENLGAKDLPVTSKMREDAQVMLTGEPLIQTTGETLELASVPIPNKTALLSLREPTRSLLASLLPL